MSLNADTLIDRAHLKGQIAKWRVVAITVIVLSVILLTREFDATPHGDYIARVTVEGIIVDDVKRDELFDDLEEDDAVKAVVLRMDSPGGTVVGGEELYRNIKELAEIKPVVVVMRSMATSAGYMATLGANRIMASPGTLTGSVGVLLQSAEITEMAQKLGIDPLVIKSGENKAAPNPLEETTPANRAMLEKVVASYFNLFLSMVVEHRELSEATIIQLSDGRVYTGAQALEIGLIDAIGNEDDAIQWLEAEAGVEADLDVEDRKPERERPEGVPGLLGQLAKNMNPFPQIQLDGLVSIWQPKPM